MNTLTPFDFHGQQVRTLIEDGEPWFVASDVAKVLGYATAKDLTRRLDPEDKGGRSVPTLGGDQQMTVINEPGLYDAVLGSRVPGAREFKRWVITEVLPSIRRRGVYLTPEATEQALTDPDFIIGLATALKEERAARAIEAPKVEAFDAFMDADGCYSIGAVAKMLGRAQNRLFDDLRAAGVLIAKGHMRNTPYQQYMHHFRVTPYSFERSDGTTGTSYTTKVRPSGVDFIRKKLGLASAPMLEVV